MGEPLPAAKSLLRQASPLLLARAISGVLTFAIPIFLARRLPPSEYGTYKQFFLVATTFYLIGQIGLPQSLYYFIPRGGAQRGRYLFGALIGQLVCGLICMVAILIGAGELARRFDNPQFATLGVSLAVYAAATMGAASLEISLTSARKTGWAGIAYVISDVARCIALIAPMQAHLGLSGIGWGAAIFAILRLLSAWGLSLSGVLGQPQLPTRETIREQLRYALPFAGAVLFSVGTMHFPSYAVSALTDAATFAVFAVGAMQIPMMDVLYSPVAEVMMVRLALVGKAGAPPVFREAVERLAVFFLPLAAFAFAIGPVLIPTLFTVQYMASIPIFALAIAEIPLSILPIEGLLRATNATRTILRVNAARFALVLVCVPIGLEVFGLAGAMAGFIATQWVARTTMLFSASRHLGVPVRALLPGRVLGAWLARSALIFAALTVLRLVGPWHGVSYLIASCALGGAIWLLSLATAGELRKRKASTTVDVIATGVMSTNPVSAEVSLG